MFPIQDGPAIPWAVIAPHDGQCQRNHGGQTLERIAQRGGLCVTEAICVLDDHEWWEFQRPPVKGPSREDALLRLQEIVRDRHYLVENAKLRAEVEEARYLISTARVPFVCDDSGRLIDRSFWIERKRTWLGLPRTAAEALL